MDQDRIEEGFIECCHCIITWSKEDVICQACWWWRRHIWVAKTKEKLKHGLRKIEWLNYLQECFLYAIESYDHDSYRWWWWFCRWWQQFDLLTYVQVRIHALGEEGRADRGWNVFFWSKSWMKLKARDLIWSLEGFSISSQEDDCNRPIDEVDGRRRLSHSLRGSASDRRRKAIAIDFQSGTPQLLQSCDAIQSWANQYLPRRHVSGWRMWEDKNDRVQREKVKIAVRALKEKRLAIGIDQSERVFIASQDWNLDSFICFRYNNNEMIRRHLGGW